MTSNDSSNSYHSSKLLDRRRDNSVRSAIDAIQNFLFDTKVEDNIFPVVSEHLKSITDSEHCITFFRPQGSSVLTSDNFSESVRVVASEGSEKIFCHETVKKFLTKGLIPARPSYFNSPLPNTHLALLKDPANVSSLIMLPLISKQALIGIILLTKKTGEYSGNTLYRLNPLLSAVVCAIQSADGMKVNLECLSHKISQNKYLSTLISTSPIAIIILDDSNTIINSNPCAYSMFICDANKKFSLTQQLMSKDIMIGQPIKRFIPEFENMLLWSNQQDPYCLNNHQFGLKIWEKQRGLKFNDEQFLVNISIFRYSHGKERYTTLQIEDISKLTQSIDEQKQASQQLNAIMNLAPTGILHIDINWNCVYANDQWYEISGLIFEECQGSGWINAIHIDDIRNFLEMLKESIQDGLDYQTEIRLITPLGKTRWIDFKSKVLFDVSGKIMGFLAAITDITEILVTKERLRHVAEFDSLTGLANRNLLNDRLNQAVLASNRDSSNVTLFFMDLDGFKDVNDTLGHDIGDLLLKKVSDRLTNTLRKEDTIARFGGDEFVILLARDNADLCVSTVASKIIEAISANYSIDGHDIYITCSIGIASGCGSKLSVDLLLKQADSALYLAKAEGKNNFQMFNDELDKIAKKRMQLVKELRMAMESKSFVLEYQPQASAQDYAFVGAEALLRMPATKGIVAPPEEFVPLLEETGMIINVGNWVIDESFRQISEWKEKNLFPEHCTLSVNISPKQLLDTTFVETLKSCCDKYQISPNKVIIEITESLLIQHSKKVENTFTQLKKLGFQLALDDFGTGYSSLTYLQRYPLDHIKIDKSFISDLGTDENDYKITEAIIALAKSLKLTITAEGVPDNDTLTIIKRLGANYYQGFQLSSSLEPTSFEKFLQNRFDENNGNVINLSSKQLKS